MRGRAVLIKLHLYRELSFIEKHGESYSFNIKAIPKILTSRVARNKWHHKILKTYSRKSSFYEMLKNANKCFCHYKTNKSVDNNSIDKETVTSIWSKVKLARRVLLHTSKPAAVAYTKELHIKLQRIHTEEWKNSFLKKAKT